MGKIVSEETKVKISKALLGNKNAKNNLGRERPEGAGSPSVQIEVLDLETNIKTIYSTMNETGRALDVPSPLGSGSIRIYFSRNTLKPYKGRYLLRKILP